MPLHTQILFPEAWPWLFSTPQEAFFLLFSIAWTCWMPTVTWKPGCKLQIYSHLDLYFCIPVVYCVSNKISCRYSTCPPLEFRSIPPIHCRYLCSTGLQIYLGGLRLLMGKKLRPIESRRLRIAFKVISSIPEPGCFSGRQEYLWYEWALAPYQPWRRYLPV